MLTKFLENKIKTFSMTPNTTSVYFTQILLRRINIASNITQENKVATEV